MIKNGGGSSIIEVRNLENPKKKRMGRQKIEIKKIEKKSALEVAFSKRRTGVFKKTAQLCILCGANAAVIVFSPAGKPFLFGHPTPYAIIRRFLDRDADTDSDINSLPVVPAGQVGVRGKLEVEDEEESGFWFDAPIERMGLKELVKFKNSIEELREKAADRVEELAMTMVTESENGAACPSSSIATVEYAPPQDEHGSSSVVHAQDSAAADDCHTLAHLHFGFDFDFDFDEFFF